MEPDAQRPAPELTVAILATQPLMRAGIEMILQQDPTISVIRDRSTPVDVVIVDDWLALRRHDHTAWPARAVPIAIAADLDRAEFLSLLRHEVICIVDRDGPTDDLMRAVHAAARGAAFIARRFTALLTSLAKEHQRKSGSLAPAQLTRLTSREQQVLSLLCQGLPNRQIADILNISVKTAKFHVSNVLSKLGHRTRAELIAAVGRWSTPSVT